MTGPSPHSDVSLRADAIETEELTNMSQVLQGLLKHGEFLSPIEGQ